MVVEQVPLWPLGMDMKITYLWKMAGHENSSIRKTVCLIYFRGIMELNAYFAGVFSKFLRLSMNRLFASILLCLALLANNKLLAQSPPTVLITYYSESGNTKALAEAVAKGANTVKGLKVILKPIAEVTIEKVLSANAIILGSPVYNANMAPQVQEFINSWPFEGRPLKDKIGAVFVTGGGFSIGEEAVMFSMIRAMMIHGMVIIGGEEVEAAFGASAITGEGKYQGQAQVDSHFLLKGEQLGKRVATWIVSLY